MLRDILPGPGWAPYQASQARVSAPAVPRADLRSSNLRSEEGSCVKGLLVGLSLEAFAAAGVFAIRHLFQLLR